MVVKIGLQWDVLNKQVEDYNDSLPEGREVKEAFKKGIEDTAEEFAERVEELAPESDSDTYQPELGNEPPEQKLKRSFYARSHGSSEFAYEVVSSEDQRAYLLEVGDSGATISRNIRDEDERNIAFPARDGNPTVDADGNPLTADGEEIVIRESVERGGIEGRKYIEQAFKEFKNNKTLDKNIRRRLDPLFES